MWFKNLRIYRLSAAWSYDARALQDALARLPFTPAAPSEMTSVGWVPPRADADLVYFNDGQYLLALRVEKKLLPASVVNAATTVRRAQVEEQQGYPPGRRQTKEIREQVIDELLPKAFSTHRDTRVWIDTRNRWLVIDTASVTVADVVLGALAKVLDPFPIAPLYVKMPPAVAMTNWLAFDEAPEGFSIDQDTELQSSGQSAAKVRYQHLSVDLDDARKHIGAGRQCTRLAMTWADRVSFALTDGLDLKRVAPLDVIKEGKAVDQNEAERFDSDFTLMAGELSRLLGDLVEALGGERV